MGEIVVNGETYNMPMPAQAVTDQEAADVMTYVLNSWGNNGGTVSVERVKAVRAKKK